MAIAEFTTDLNIIAALDDEPNDSGGLTPAQAKAKFDEGALALQTYLNEVHIPELDAVHVPYDYTVAGGQTIKEAMEDLTAGVMLDNSVTAAKLTSDSVTTAKIADGNVTFEKLNSSVLATEAAAQAGTAENSIMNPLRTKQAIQVSDATTQAGVISILAAGATYTVTFAFTPTCVLVCRASAGTLSLFRSGDSFRLLNGDEMNAYMDASLSGNTLSFTTQAGYNWATKAYNYIAFR